MEGVDNEVSRWDDPGGSAGFVLNSDLHYWSIGVGGQEDLQEKHQSLSEILQQ